MSQIYDRFKDDDGFLYITYSGENTYAVLVFLYVFIPRSRTRVFIYIYIYIYYSFGGAAFESTTL